MASSKSNPTTNVGAKAAFSVREFCEVYGISRSLFYAMIKEGQGPVTMKVRGRRLVSRQSAADWRRRMESPVPHQHL